MNKLLLLSIALLSVNLYGQEKLIYSKTGLEGWGKADPTQAKKEGVEILVEDYSNKVKTFDVKAIENQVELKLRLAGIKVDKDAGDKLYINMMPVAFEGRIIGYALQVRPTRRMVFKHKEKIYVCFVTSHKIYSGTTPLKYREELDEWLDDLLLNYLKANPKKE